MLRNFGNDDSGGGGGVDDADADADAYADWDSDDDDDDNIDGLLRQKGKVGCGMLCACVDWVGTVGLGWCDSVVEVNECGGIVASALASASGSPCHCDVKVEV